MELSNAVREVTGVIIITLEGRLQFGESTTALRELVKSLVEEGRRSVVLELRNLSYIDSAGLGTLMGCFTSMRNGGGTLKLLSPSNRVRNQLVMMKLFPIFEVFEDEAAVVASFSKAAGA